jgi:hypothetical protein
MAKLKLTDSTGYTFQVDDLAQLGGLQNTTQTAPVAVANKIIVQGMAVDNLHNIPNR